MDQKPETKKVVKITEKQKAARAANLAKGREKKKENLKLKNEEPKHDEYDIGSDDDDEYDASSEEETFVVSKKKPKSSTHAKPAKVQDTNQLKDEVEELKSMVLQLATIQKKQQKQRKERPKISVLLPKAPANEPKTSTQHYDNMINTLQQRLGF